MYTHMCMCVFIYIYTCIGIYIYTYKHTYIYMYVHIRIYPHSHIDLPIPRLVLTPKGEPSVAVCCRVLQSYVAVCRSVLECVAVICQYSHTKIGCDTRRRVEFEIHSEATLTVARRHVIQIFKLVIGRHMPISPWHLCCNVLQCVAGCCSVMCCSHMPILPHTHTPIHTRAHLNWDLTSNTVFKTQIHTHRYGHNDQRAAQIYVDTL